MPELPLAFFITFHSYGTWLHGQNHGSVDKDHNEYGTPFLPGNADQYAQKRERMTQAPYLLDDRRRAIVCEAIVQDCQFRGWQLRAVHVRSNHVHLVVSADRDPDDVVKSCKTNASKFLNRAGFEDSNRKRWATHGSTLYLWSEEAVADKIDYTLNRQGEPMARFPI